MTLDIFEQEIRYDPSVMLPIWVNYFESREKREKIAKEKWLQLYEKRPFGKCPNDFWENLIHNCLEPFAEITCENKELTSKLVHDCFEMIKKSFSTPSFEGKALQTFLEKMKNNISLRKRIFSKGENWQEISNKMRQLLGELASKPDAAELLEMYNKILQANVRTNKKLNPQQNHLDDVDFASLEKEYNDLKTLQESIKTMQQHFMDYFRKLNQIKKIFGDISVLAGLGWDLSKSILKSRKWLQLEQTASLLEKYENLQKIVELLGRLRYQEEFKIEEVLQEIPKKIAKSLVSPLARNELYGIHFSDDLQRLLPSELSLLGHPRWKKLFYAKFIEKRLMSYELKGVIPIDGKQKSKQQNRIFSGRGPIILCLDTSGSMSGFPENIAKAIALLALKIATKEKRNCYLISFSSSGELQELEIAQSPAALDNLLHFLTYSFGGGTDFVSPLEKAIEIIEQQNFAKADILMVTDGQGAITKQFGETLEKAKEEKKFRIFSILVGHHSTENGVLFSDQIFHFNRIIQTNVFNKGELYV